MIWIPILYLVIGFLFAGWIDRTARMARLLLPEQKVLVLLVIALLWPILLGKFYLEQFRKAKRESRK